MWSRREADHDHPWNVRTDHGHLCLVNDHQARITQDEQITGTVESLKQKFTHRNTLMELHFFARYGIRCAESYEKPDETGNISEDYKLCD